MKKLTFLRYWNVITICLFCLALAGLGIFFASGKSGQSATEVLPAQTEISSIESFSSSGNEVIMGETQNVGADDWPSYEIKGAGFIADKNEVQHTTRWEIKISNYNGNKYNPVVVTVSGCALPPAEKYTEYVAGSGHAGSPLYGADFNNTPSTTTSWLPNQAGSTKVTTYTYTSAKGNADGTYTVTPGQKLIITSFEKQPIVRGVSTIKTSNLFVYATSSSFAAQQQYNQEYGTTQTFTVDTVDTDGYGATYISSPNNQGVTNTGKYLKSWSLTQTGTDAKFDATTGVFTFGATDSKIAGTWENLTYKIIYVQNGREMGRSTVQYGGAITDVPNTTSLFEGYRGYYQLFGTAVKNGDLFYYADYGSTLQATWVDVPNDYTITWNANGGTFENGTTVQYTTTTFGQAYTMPTPVTRPGYTFKGWYVGSTEVPGFDIELKNRLEKVTETVLHARWEIRNDLTVRFSVDERVEGFDLKITDVYNNNQTQTTNWQYIKDHSHTFTNVFGCTEFEISNMVFQDGWVFYQFNLKNTQTGLEAEVDKDYTLVQNDDKYVIKAFSSLEITVTSCIKLTIKAVSNFDGTYSVNNDGGLVAIGDEDFVNESTAVVPQGQAIKLSAKRTDPRDKAIFMGFYSDYKDGPDEEKLLSPAGENVWYTNSITATQTVYAIFKFEHYTVNVFAYSDEKNFLDSEGLDENHFDQIGGRVAVKASYDNSAFSFDKSAGVTITNGYDFNLGISVNSSSKPNSRYVFVGFYTSFEEMKADTSNSHATLTSTNPTITINGENITYYAKFVLQYAFIVNAGTEGIISVSVGNAAGQTKASQYYVYGQKIGAISCKYDTTSYNLRNPVWKLIHGDLTDTQKDLLSTQTITSIGTMPAGYIELSAGVEEKFFTLTIVALYADLNTFTKSVFGGTATVTSSKDEDIVLGSDNGIMTTHHTISASVKYKSTAITLSAITKTATAAGTNYVFLGWFDGFSNGALVGDRLDSATSGGTFHISQVKTDATYYCAFARAFAVQITADNRIDDVVFEGLATTKTENQAVVFSALASYNQSVKFEVKLARGLMDKYIQTQSGAAVKITTNETMTIFEFTMPSYPVYITLTTKANDFYLLSLRSFFVDDMQGYYDDDVGFEAGCGTVSLDEVSTAGTTLRQHVEVASSRTLVATPGIGYSFLGWFKLRTEVSFMEILKDDAPSYQTAIQDWFNIYDPITNPTAPYTFFSSELVVQSDPIERLDKNLYIAVFVKDYNLTLMAGDKGITDITFAATTAYDRNDDGALDALESAFEDQGSYKLITAPYGTIFDVYTFTAEKYQFAEYQIISGGTSLLHYGIANGKILASNGKLLEDNDWNLNFYLYDTIQILARTFTTFAELTVHFITYDINGEPVTSMEGGTFYGATQQAQTFDMAIGTSLIGFLQPAPGFVFDHFEINGERQPHGIVMPSEATTLFVFFNRNAYILETHIKSIGVDEILRDNDEGGAIFADHSILFGDVATLNLVATIGYQIEGIYLDEACTILAPDFETQMNGTQQIIDYCFHYTYTTGAITQVPSTPTTPAFTFYVVYKLRLFDIVTESQRTDLNTQTTTEIEDIEYSITDFGTNAMLEQGYYGQSICLDLPQDQNVRYYNFYNITITGKETGNPVELKFFVDGQPVQATENGFGCLADGVTIYFIMPLEAITIKFEATYYQMNLVFDATTLAGTFQNEYSQPDDQGFVQAFVYYNFDNYTCKDENAIKLDVLSSGVPYATKIGFKLVAYNTMPDRSGVDFITYDYDDYDTLVDVTINDFVFENDPAIWQAPITLYAVYDYANVDMLVNYCQSSELFYNGKLQQVLQAEINNFNAEIPYIFTWIDPNGDVVGKYDFHADTYYDADNNALADVSDFYIETQVVDGKTISILQIRSVNQSGNYVCNIEIDGGMMFKAEPVFANDNLSINIKQKILNVYLEKSVVYYGPTTLDITESNVAGLILELHTISGTISMLSPDVYDAYNPPMYNLKISRLDNGESVQDGFDILSNYKVNFTGSCEIKEDTGFIAVTAGVYLRMIDAIYMNEIFRTTPETNFIVYNMIFDGFEDDSQRRGQGTIINYLKDSDENFGADKIISISHDYRFGYGLYQLRVNGEILPSDSFSVSETTISFALDRKFVKDNKIDIQVYVTNESLVTAHFNLANVDPVQIKQVYNQTFNAPTFSSPEEGFTLDGWYFDNEFKHKVPDVWQTTGAQDIYAKWVLEDLSGDLAIVVKDNGQIQKLTDGAYEKTYNANAVSLDYACTLESFTIEVAWFKQSQFGVWQPLATGEEKGLFNVSQSGTYSFSAVITAGSGQQQTINVGKFTAEIKILPHKITLEDGMFNKTYDGKYAFAHDVFVNVLSGELGVDGVFAQKDVLVKNDVVSPIEIQNLKLISKGSELAENYVILNEKVYGVIFPMETQLLAKGTKVYDGDIYSVKHQQKTAANEFITFILKSTQPSVDIYQGSTLEFEPLSASSALTNYSITLHDESRVEITKAKHNFVLKNKVVVYDGQPHEIFATNGGEKISTNIEGVVKFEYTYTQNGNPINDLSPINAGTYTVTVTVISDKNFENFTAVATLTIKKASFNIEFLLGENKIPATKVFDDIEEIDRIKVQTDIDSSLEEDLGMKLVITKDDDPNPVQSVKDVGIYKLLGDYDTNNFECTTPNYTYYTITGQIVVIGDIFKQELVYGYNSTNHLNSVLADALNDPKYTNICDIEIKTTTRKNAAGVFAKTDSIINAGTYKVIVAVHVKDEESFAFENGVRNEFEISVIVKPFTINEFKEVDISKDYDGKTTFDNTSVLIDFNDGNIKTETISGEFVSKTAGEVKAIRSISISNSENYAFSLTLIASLSGKINKKALTINLQNNNQFVSVLYNNSDTFVYEINETNQKYVIGLVEGEMLFLQISCNTANFAGDKQYPLSLESGNDFAVVLKNTATIIGENEFVNYEITSVEGGLNILKQQLIIAEIVENGDGFDNVFDNKEKEIHAKLNNVLCVYNTTNSVFVPMNAGENAPANVGIKDYAAFVDAGTHEVILTLGNNENFSAFAGGTVIDGQQCIELEYTILPYQLESNTTYTPEYGAQWGNLGGTVAATSLSANFIFNYTLNLSTQQQRLPGTYELSFNTKDNGDILKLSSNNSSVKVDNFILKFDVRVVVFSKSVLVEHAAFENLVYTGLDQTPQVNPTFLNAANHSEMSLGDDAFTIVFYFNGIETSTVVNAGNYSVMIFATDDRYVFNDGQGIDYPYKEIGNFEITKADLSAQLSGTQNFVFDANFHAPISATFKFNGVTMSNITHKITYGNGLETIKDAGEYPVTLEISHSNFKLGTVNNVFVTISPYEFAFAAPEDGEMWWSKYYGQQDPITLQKIFTTPFGDTIDAHFVRESGEAVGEYKVSITEEQMQHLEQTYTNYDIQDFEDQFGAFHILSYKEISGKLTIEMVDNISVPYNGEYISSISLNDYPNTFKIYDNNKQPISASICDLSNVIFGFEFNQVKDVGTYNLVILSVDSTTHDDFELLLNGKQFLIIPKAISVQQQEYSKEYDATVDAQLDIQSVVGIYDIDRSFVSLTAKFDNKNVGTNKVITLGLSGPSAKNYVFENENATIFGNITAREVSLDGSFDKIYDGQTVVDPSKFLIENVCSGDNLVANGNFETKHAGEDKIINFTLAGADAQNYTLGNVVYTADIYKKVLGYAQKDFAKQYDASANADVELSDITGIVAGDDISIEKAVYVDIFDTEQADATVGDKYLKIIFAGTDKDNYELDLLPTSIKLRYINLQYHYGDESEYLVEFVDDGQVINKKQQTQEVAYGFAVNYPLYNEINTLASPTRTGYDFAGWQIRDKNSFVPFTESTNTNIVDIKTLEQNDWTIHLYAAWQIQTIWVQIVVMTENIANSDFAESDVGGTFSFDGQTDQTRFESEYYQTHIISAIANEFFEFVNIQFDDEIVTSSPQYQFVTTQNLTIKLNFARSEVNVILHTGEFDVLGFNEAIWKPQNGTLVATTKYNGVVKLPALTTYGHIFGGFEDANHALYQQTESLTVMTSTLELWAIFTPKTIQIAINTAGGVGDENFAYADKDNKIIEVVYGTAFGKLPSLQKMGYEFVSFMLYNGLNLIEKVDENTILKTAETNLMLLAVWDKNDNMFEVSSSLDESAYHDFGITNFERFDNPFKIFYNLGLGSGFVEYINPFVAPTESVVTLKMINSAKNIYQFAYWQVDGQIITNDMEISGVQYKLVFDGADAMLQISGFVWENTCPSISAKFVPVALDFEIAPYDTNLGNVEVVSGVVNNQTLAGAKIELAFTETAGYHLNQNKTTAQGANITFANAQMLLDKVTDNVVISPVFSQNQYGFTITKSGFTQGVAYVKYAINSDAMADYVTQTLIKTGDMLLIKIALLNGYTLKITADKQEVELIENSRNQLASAQEIFIDVSGFLGEFNVNLEIGKEFYDVSAQKKLYNPQTGAYTDLVDNTITVQDAFGVNVTKVAYLEKVVYAATITTTNVNQYGSDIQNVEYKFLGWYAEINGEMILVSGAMVYQFDVVEDVEYIAVFEKIVFTVTFHADDNFGKIVGTSQEVINRVEYVVAGGKLQGTYQVLPSPGYQFMGWNVSLIYNDANKTTLTQTLSDALVDDLGEIHANITAVATFAKIDISVNLSANRLDEKPLSESTIVKFAEDSGHSIDITTQTRTILTFKAIAGVGYQFVSWTFENLVGSDYQILSTQSTTEYKYDEETGAENGTLRTIHIMEIEFIGNVTQYNVIANFDVAEVRITTTFAAQGIDVVSAGVFEEDGEIKNSTHTFVTKADTTLTCFINVYEGFLLLEDEFGACFISDNLNINIEIIDATNELSAEQKTVFSGRYKVIITGFNEDSTITIWADSQKTKLNFAKLSNFFDNTFVENAFTGYIKYYTKDIVVDDGQTLKPSADNCVFMGWSTTQNANGLITDANGNLIETYWTSLEKEISLYPIYDYASVRVDVVVAPSHAVVNKYTYLDEVFTNDAKGFTIENGLYYYNVGASFSLGVPQFIEHYHFDSFVYHIVNSEGQIQKITIKSGDIETNFATTKMFNVPSESAFDYSLAANFANFEGLEDGVMQITIVCSVDINYKAENFYGENCQDVIGGTIYVANLSNTFLAVYNEEIQLVAVPSEGYTVKGWWINGVKQGDVQTLTLPHTVIEPTEFVVKFVGKRVEITLDGTNAKTVELTGGNAEIMDESGTYLRHVGDIINLSAIAGEGFTFTGNWLHSNGGQIGAEYIITAADGESGAITLTPVFEARKVQVYMLMPYGFGTISKDGLQLSASRVGDNM
ncbi:MAG: InlB B-repeat-containing protein [Clostridia bacterium]|nr:InlB B-repeat-containing protein [Clostridia bacterium]